MAGRNIAGGTVVGWSDAAGRGTAAESTVVGREGAW